MLIILFAAAIIIGIGYLLIRNKDTQKEKPLEEVFMEKETSPEVKITVVYDNNPFDERLRTGWGFGCLVETGTQTILFDTGADAETLLSNMRVLSIDPQKINIIVLSHIHGDHVGGLFGFLEKNSKVAVSLPSLFPQSFKDRVKSFGASIVEVSDSTSITDGVLTTGEMGTFIKEQSLVVKTEKGLIVITGCAHPGIVNIVKKAKEITDEEVFLVLGGFHLRGASNSQLRDIVKDFRLLRVQKAAPCHCSGDRCRELFKEEYEDDYIEAGVGKIIKLSRNEFR